MGRRYAGTLGLIGFTTTVVRAILLGGEVESSMRMAVLNSLIFAVLGAIAGVLAEQVVAEGVLLRFEQELKANGEVTPPGK